MPDTPVELTRAERDTLTEALRMSGAAPQVNRLVCAAVERILAARLAPRPPQDDPQLDERERLWRILTPYVRLCYRADLGAVDAVLAAGFRLDPDAIVRHEPISGQGGDVPRPEGQS